MAIIDSAGTKPQLSGYDAIIIGAGFAGSVVARELAERAGKKVAIVESRNHVGGNAYDRLDDAGVLIHQYGPHIFHTNSQRAFEYVRRFTEWLDYQHEVLANLGTEAEPGPYIPVPFNKNSIEKVFDAETAERYIKKLIDTFGDEVKVPIIKLREMDDPELAEIADFVYNNVFLRYTQKQWGLTPEQVDPSVTARVPVFISRDNRYFQDTYQGMPLEGYTKIFENMLDHENIDVYLSVDGRDVFEFSEADGKTQALVDGQPYGGIMVYTGAIDELFDCRFGRLPYRSLDFVYETYDQKHWQPCGTVNYTVSEDYTRITEFTYLSGQDLDKTTIMKEYSRAYEALPGQIPYYAIISEENQAHYNQYKELADSIANFHLIGRLAEYRYYNMDAIIVRALELADELCG